MDRYQEAMQDFSVLKDRVIGRQITDPPVAKKQHKVESEVEGDEDDIDESVIGTLPENQQYNAKTIMRVYRLTQWVDSFKTLKEYSPAL